MIRPATKRPGSRKSAARTSGSKTVNSVATWVRSRHFRPLDHSRLAYQSSPSGALSASSRALITARSFLVYRKIIG